MSKFEKGIGCVKCQSCGRLCRPTHGAFGVKTCNQCWDLAGIYNELQDGADIEDLRDEIRQLCDEIEKRGGTLCAEHLEMLA